MLWGDWESYRQGSPGVSGTDQGWKLWAFHQAPSHNPIQEQGSLLTGHWGSPCFLGDTLGQGQDRRWAHGWAQLSRAHGQARQACGELEHCPAVAWIGQGLKASGLMWGPGGRTGEPWESEQKQQHVLIPSASWQHLAMRSQSWILLKRPAFSNSHWQYRPNNIHPYFWDENSTRSERNLESALTTNFHSQALNTSSAKATPCRKSHLERLCKHRLVTPAWYDLWHCLTKVRFIRPLIQRYAQMGTWYLDSDSKYVCCWEWGICQVLAWDHPSSKHKTVAMNEWKSWRLILVFFHPDISGKHLCN